MKEITKIIFVYLQVYHSFQCILIIFFPFPQILADSSHFPTHPTSCSLSEKSKQTNKTNKTKLPKQNKKHTKHMESLLHWSTTLGMGSVLGDIPLKKTEFFFCLQVSTAVRFLVRGKTLCLASLFHAFIWF